jgi:hypothetical protein
MPIKKETSARFVKTKVPYEVLSREVIQSINNPIALAIYCYLMTMPENWVPRKKHIIEHFTGLGDDRYSAAMKELKSSGLVWLVETRSPDGTFCDRVLVVEATPQMGKTPHGENPALGKPCLGENPPLRDTDITTDTDMGIRGWNEWVGYRKEIKKKMTPATVKKQAAFLKDKTPDQQQAIIDQSIQNGWTGLFEIKEVNKNGNNQQSNNGHKDQRRLSGAEKTRLAREAAYRREHQV